MKVCVFFSLFTLLCVGLCRSSTHAGNCTAPVLSVASLEVEYGHPANVTCSIQKKPDSQYKLGWETKLSQTPTENETSVTWEVKELTNWEEPVGISCFFTWEHQCETRLNLIIYKKPDSVKLSSSPEVWVEGDGEGVELRCEVVNVGPGRILSVRWSRADPKQNTFTIFNESPVPALKNETKNGTGTAILTITPRREDDGAQYQCEALLNLNQPLVFKSEKPFTSSVHYKPTINVLTVHEGETLTINCSADGNPRPQFNYTLPNNTTISSSSSIFNISRVHQEVEGQYTCTAYNYLDKTTKSKVIKKKENFYWLLFLLIVPIVLGIWAFIHYRHQRIGQYILRHLGVSHANQNTDRP